MEAVSVARNGVPGGGQTRSLSGLKPVHASLSTKFRGSPVESISSKRFRLLGRAFPVGSQNDVNLTQKISVRRALDVQRNRKNGSPKVEPSPADEVARRRTKKSPIGSIVKTIANALYEFLQYTTLEEDITDPSDYSAPVDEIGEKVLVEVISGAIPQNFPGGTYIRTGPNPVFGTKTYKSKLGITKRHLFEGDGMLHAVYFDKCGGGEYKLYYKNRYVEAEGYLLEKEAGRPIVAGTLEGEPFALLINILLNQLRFGFLAKPTCNTSVWGHGGRLFAASENSLPYEINISDLSTVGEFTCKGTWPVKNFIAHPKIDPMTNELIFQGFSALQKPHTKVGVIAADGETLVHVVDVVGSERLTLSHDMLITERYTVVMDFPLLIDPAHFAKGKPLVLFDQNSYSRFAILPRFGDSGSVRWFEVETYSMLHAVNAYDDGDEVVVHGLRSRTSFFNVDMNLDKMQWYKRGITPGVSEQEGYDPLVDGALLTYLHEWRFNLETGTVTERDIYDEENYVMMDFPRLNESYVGRKYRYAYGAGTDLDRFRETGVPYFGTVSKLDFSSVESGKGVVKCEVHELGPNRYGGEPVFVAKPGNNTQEDDGWVVLFVHDGNTNLSEAIIIDAQRFSEEPVARIRLPQRVPFGFHGTFVPAG